MSTKSRFTCVWTENQLRRLNEACVLYPIGTQYRMKRIANYVGEPRSSHQCRDKLRKMSARKKDEPGPALKFEPTFPIHEQYPFGSDGHPIDNKQKPIVWTPELKSKFKEALSLFPPTSPQCNVNIAKYIGHGLTKKQVMHHKESYFLRRKQRGVPKPVWSLDMERKLSDAVREHTGPRGVCWESVNKVMNMQNTQCKAHWHMAKYRILRFEGVVNVGEGLGHSCTYNSSSSAVTEAEDYLSESDYWVDVSDPATTKRLNRRKRNRDLFCDMMNSSGGCGVSVSDIVSGYDHSSGTGNVLYVVHSSDSSGCGGKDSVCSDDMCSGSDVDYKSRQFGCDSSYPMKRKRHDNVGVCDIVDDSGSIDFENYVTITDELIDMLGLYDSSSGESDCE